MKNVQLTYRQKVMLIIVIHLAIILGVFFVRLNTLHAEHTVLVSICDGFAIGGAMYLICAVISIATAKGGLDGVFYICRIVANLFSSEKSLQGKPLFISYYDFLKGLEHRPSNAKLYAIIGGISFAISLILYLLLNYV